MPDDKTGDHTSKSKRLNESLNITEGETFDHETGEVTASNVTNSTLQTSENPTDTANHGDINSVSVDTSNAPTYTFDDIKTKMEASQSIEALNDVASLISSLPITKDEHSKLTGIYRKRVIDIKKSEAP
jgi:hypothetical protein